MGLRKLFSRKNLRASAEETAERATPRTNPALEPPLPVQPQQRQHPATAAPNPSQQGTTAPNEDQQRTAAPSVNQQATTGPGIDQRGHVVPNTLARPIETIVLQRTNKHWRPVDTGAPETTPLDGNGIGKTWDFTEYTRTLKTAWIRGEDVRGRFGPKVFDRSEQGVHVDLLPPLLFDLLEERLVDSSNVAPTNYVFISHVWGDTVQQVDGSRYDVPWSIPVKNQMKLEQVLEAARIAIGYRYVWMDILCLDQRQPNAIEVARMRTYLENASGCMVWLEDGVEDVRTAVTTVNGFLGLDAHYLPNAPCEELTDALKLSLREDELLNYVRQIKRIEKSDWFKRVWTLQEAVVPDNIRFCTPDKCITTGAVLFEMIAFMEMMVKQLAGLGLMSSIPVAAELQTSELFKVWDLRRLYRQKAITFWHIDQAIRTRSCKFERDRVLGVSAMLREVAPTIDFNQTPARLYQDLFMNCIEAGQFSALLCLGGPLQAPAIGITHGLMTSTPVAVEPPDTLICQGDGIRMPNAGISPIPEAYCMIGRGSFRQAFESRHDLRTLGHKAQTDIARAFDLKTDIVNNCCPGFFAAQFAFGNGLETLLAPLGQEVWKAFHENRPRAILTWQRAEMLMQGFDNCALYVLSDGERKPQLAVIHEPLEEQRTHRILVMPRSATTSPTEGCLVCNVSYSTNRLWKVGVGLGKELKASFEKDVLLYPGPA